MAPVVERKITVLEVHQLTSIGNVAGTKFEDWKKDLSLTLPKTVGGDSEIRKVRRSDNPRLGYVWFRPNKNGILRRWKVNYDSSG